MRKLVFVVVAAVLLAVPASAAMTLDQVVSKHLEAHGGEAAWQAIDSIEITGRFTAFSKVRDFKLIHADGNYYWDTVMDDKQVIIGYDGDDLWWDASASQVVTKSLTLDGATDHYLGLAAGAKVSGVLFGYVRLNEVRPPLAPIVFEFDVETTIDSDSHVLIPAEMNPHGLVITGIYAIVTEAMVGSSEDQGIITVSDESDNSLATLTATDGAADAIGDIVGGPALAHVASAEGITCVEKIAGHNPHPVDYNNIPGCTYTSPEVASVGMTEKAAKDAGYELKVGKFPFTASGKASAAGAKDGFVKLVFDAKYGELLGAHMIGANVTEMIAELVVARKLETTGEEIIKAVHPHPTMSEAVMEAAAAAYGEVIHL